MNTDSFHFFDSHAHLTSSSLYDTVDQVIARAQAAKIGTILNICTDIDSLKKGLQLHSRYSHIYNAAATHPHDVEKQGESQFSLIADHARRGDLVAIGETGLDYHYLHSPADTQRHFLRQYLRLALECQLPVIIHCREAFADLFPILDQEYSHAPGVLHCFTGTMEEAEQVLKRGWFLSLSGVITFKKSYELREVAKYVPLEQLLIETDAPFLAPQTKRGQQNEPAFLTETAAVIAAIKGISEEELASLTSHNARLLFKLPSHKSSR